MSDAISDPLPHIYADELWHYGHGYPLWRPDPDPSVTEVELGDVGWLEKGGFYQLFNSMKAEGEPQVRENVPSGFQRFCPPAMAIAGPYDKITDQVLRGRSVQQADAAVEVTASTSSLPSISVDGSVGIDISFKSTSDRGAFLALSPPGVYRYIQSKIHVINYMRAHFNHWVEFANTTMGIGLKDEDILFVSGTVKTSQCAVAAFCDKSRNVEGSFTADLGSLGDASVSMFISSETLRLKEFRRSPSQRISSSSLLPDHDDEPSSQAGTPSPSPPPEQRDRDQCIFMNYYKMKRRFWRPFPMQAAGYGYRRGGTDTEHDSDPGSQLCVVDDDDMDVDEYGTGSGQPEYIDPVVHLLDYILEHSSASYAVACDTDVTMLLNAQNSTEDIKCALVNMPPEVEVDENGVGCIWSPSSKPEIQSTSVPCQSPQPLLPRPVTAPTARRRRRPSPAQLPPSLESTPASSSLPYQAQGPPKSQPTPQNPANITYTDDAFTKVSERVRRRCFNCRATDTSVWRRSVLSPGKVICNRCRLYENTHSRPRPKQDVVYTRSAGQSKQHRNTPSPGPSHAVGHDVAALITAQKQQQQQASSSTNEAAGMSWE